MELNLIKPEKINLLNHPTLDEKWIQEVVAKDPSILGLGEFILRDKERVQPHAGRLDLLLQDPDSEKRYEVEIQLGKVDESHIIRTIEYWDVERKRFPQYDHCAVIVAEDITSRFLNVISIFNGHIPLVALQMNAYKHGNDCWLTFTPVLKEINLGATDDEDVKEITDRNYWEKRATSENVALADKMHEMINSFVQGYKLNYTKFYIGLANNGRPDNFASFVPKKNYMRLELKLDEDAALSKAIEDKGLELMNYDNTWNQYRIRLSVHDVSTHKEFITSLLEMAYKRSSKF